MSHFAVLVFLDKDQSVDDDSLDSILAPYNENLKVEPYVECTKAEAIAKAKEWWHDCYKTDEEYYKHYLEVYEEQTDEDGNILTTYNPKSKWDWWVVGGRFSGMLKLKTGKYVDYGLVKDLDFSPDEATYKFRLHFWDVVVDHQPVPEGEEDMYFTLYNEEYYKDYYGTRENYAKICAQFSTYAVVTPDGVWHGKGDMGYWGLSSETPKEAQDWEDNYHERFIQTADPKWTAVIIDCHI